MPPSMYESRIRQLQGELKRHRDKQAAEEAKAARAQADADRFSREAGRSTSPTSRQSKQRQADAKRDEANRARAAAAKASKAVADGASKLLETERRLQEEQTRTARARAQQQERERRQLERDQRSLDARRQRETAELRDRTGRLERHLAALAPEKIVVAFIASSPADQGALRLDREVREIQQRLRASDHRDAVEFVVRPATQVQDLFQILAEVKPHVVHFSGHGNRGSLVFEDDDGKAKTLSNELVALLLSTSSDRIQLAVFNSCESSEAAALACAHIRAAIGMELSIEDEAAKTFAGQFYNAIGFGRSLQAAFDQACAQVRITQDGRLSGEPRLYTAEGIDADGLILVSPAGGDPLSGGGSTGAVEHGVGG